MVEINPATNKTLSLDLQFLPYNKRNIETISNVLERRLMPGIKILYQINHNLLTIATFVTYA